MSIETANDLAEAVRDLGLVEAERQGELACLAEAFPCPRDLARRMLERGWLTPFQANHLLQGKGDQLVLGPYHLLERIGTGGMGEVFKARHRRLHRLAAVKILNSTRLKHPSAIERFAREVQAAAQLSHPNIVAVHDAGSEGDTHYLAMQYIDGLDLGRLVGKLGPLPFSLASAFLAQAALGLHHAHELGFVHRDVKPPNLLVAPRGGLGKPGGSLAVERFVGATVKVLDMGLVRLQPHRLDESHLALTYHGVVIGTMDYLAPEQARNAHRVDRRADLYSLGCTLYHLLAGRPPFPGATAMDKLLRHQTDEAQPLGELRPDVPAELEAVLRRLMAKRPEGRFATAAEVAEALAPFAGRAPEPVLLAGPAARAGAPLEPTCVAETPFASEVTQPAALILPPRRTSSRRRKSRRSRVRIRWWCVAGAVSAALLLLLVLLHVASAPPDAAPAKERKPAPARDHEGHSRPRP
jgi:serine/threonine-protein kinase